MAEEHTEDQVTEPRDEPRETQDVKATGLARFGIGLAIGIAVSMALMAGLNRLLTKWVANDAPVSRYAVRREERLPPLPRQLAATGNRFKPEDFTSDPELQRELEKENLNFELLPPERYREVYDRVKQRELTSYGALADQPGRFRIPIDEAKRLLVERGATAAATPSPNAAPTNINHPPGMFTEDSPTAAGAGRVPERSRQ